MSSSCTMRIHINRHLWICIHFVGKSHCMMMKDFVFIILYDDPDVGQMPKHGGLIIIVILDASIYFFFTSVDRLWKDKEQNLLDR